MLSTPFSQYTNVTHIPLNRYCNAKRVGVYYYSPPPPSRRTRISRPYCNRGFYGGYSHLASVDIVFKLGWRYLLRNTDNTKDRIGAIRDS